jgi:hypothetical protein
MSNHCLLEKYLRLALKYELGLSCMCIRVAALVCFTFGTSLLYFHEIQQGGHAIDEDFRVIFLNSLKANGNYIHQPL